MTTPEYPREVTQAGRRIIGVHGFKASQSQDWVSSLGFYVLGGHSIAAVKSVHGGNHHTVRQVVEGTSGPDSGCWNQYSRHSFNLKSLVHQVTPTWRTP